MPVTSQQTVTGYTTIVVSATDIVYTSEPLPPTTVIIPTSITAGPSNGTVPPTTTGPVTVPTGGADSMRPAVALVAGFIGALVLI